METVGDESAGGGAFAGDGVFDGLVEEAMAALPAEVTERLDNVAFFIADDPPPEAPSILGLYEGIALTERDAAYGFVPPDTITLFKNQLIACARDEDELYEQIYITIVHEVAHHHGIDDDELHELGWG